MAKETDEAAPQRPSPAQPSGASALLKRYGPFAVIAVVVVAAIAVFGGGGGGDDDDDTTSAPDAAAFDREELIRNGPMTPEKAELEGETDIDFGPNCDTETGRIKLPTIYAAPCVQPFEGDNGGATYQGVTADSIKVVAHVPDPALDPLGAAALSGGGADLDPDTARQTLEDYVAMYNQLFETYGRTIDFEVFTGTGSSDDQEAAKADAIAIAEKEPFAVIGGPLQVRETFIDELTARDVVCPPGCGVALNEDFIEERDPLISTLGPTSNQASRLAADAIGKLAGPGKAEMAGDEATKAKDRVYAVVHYDTPDGAQTEAFEELTAQLSNQGIELETDVEFFLDFSRMQENARTIINQLESAGVTTVIFFGDPIMPQALTEEATAQGFNPEWILGPNLLADTAYFGRTYDQAQWGNGFGIAFATTPGIDEIGDSFMIYDWAYDRDPPSNIYAILEPPLRTLYTAIHMAGENLTAESFRDGLLRLPERGGGVTRPVISYGYSDNWPDYDYGSADDVAIIWWDEAAEGTDELGQQGFGMYRFANGGERYTLGNFPDSIEAAGLFDNDSSVIELRELPAEDAPPDYPPPEL